MKLQNLLITFGLALGFGVTAKAQTFDLNLSGGGYTVTGSITDSTSLGGGIYSALSGSITFDGLTFQLDPVPSGQSEVVVQNPAGSGGLNLSGDDKIGANYISGDGLIFTAPPSSGSNVGFTGDTVNIWGNGGSSYTLACYGPDLPSGDPFFVNLTGTVVATPEPKTWQMGLIAAVGFAAFGLVRRKLTA